MKLDLHVHTTASDGSCDPSDVVERAAASGLDVISISDHDTVAALPRAIRAAAARSLQIVPGIEVSSTLDDREYHILGYFIDPDAPAVRNHERRAVELRGQRMLEMVGRLKRQGLLIEMDDVLEAVGPDGSVVGRPHLARALVARGHASSIPDAFERLIGDGHPAYVPTRLLSPTEAIQVVLQAGGIPVWAHPPAQAVDRVLAGFVQAGLRGLEVYRPWSRAGHMVALERAARNAGLLVTGGSDWHGPQKGPSLGDFFVTGDEVAEFLEEGGL